MVGRLHIGAAPRGMRSLALWQRLAVAGALLVALTISAALVIFQPGERSLAPSDAAPQTTAAPALPPGTDTYYYWGQHRPLDQQP